MKRLFAILIIAAACFGQGKQNVLQTGLVDAHGASWRFPESTFAGLPSAASGNTGWRYTVTDCLTSACTAGGGSVQADLRSTGSAWVVISGGGGGGSPMVGAANHVQTTDGAGNPVDGGCTMTLATGLNCPPQGGAAAAYAFVQGTSNTPPANSVLIQAPTSVPTAFDITLWSAPTAGFVVASGANPSVLLPRAIANADLPTAALAGVLKYTAGVPAAIGTSATNCVHEDGSSGACGSGSTSVTTKGDLQGFSTTPNRFPVGADGRLLVADSSQAFGLNWYGKDTVATANTIVQRDANANITLGQSTPVNSSAACNAGTIWSDSTYLYVCTASGVIKRVTLSTF